MSKYLWKFYWDCRRQGEVEGLFVATEKEIQEAIGKEVYFGEILGKHSEVYGTFEEADIRKIDIDSDAVEKVAKELGDNWSGYNPLDYIRYECSRCEDTCSMEDMYNIEGERVCWSCTTNEEREEYE